MHHFKYSGGVLCCEGVRLDSLAKRYGTPLYVYSHDALTRHYKVFDRAFKGMNHMICYSVKANSTLAVLAALARQGAGADIVSGGELYRALHAGINPQDIVYSGVGKTDEEINYALRAGIRLFNIESEEELARIDALAGKLKHKAPVGIRINPDIDAQTHPHIATGLKSEKFGIDIEASLATYRRAARLKHVDILGLTCHIGSQILQVEPFVDALRKLRALLEALRGKGFQIRYLDVGGGLGIDYGKETPPHPDQYARAIMNELADFSLCLILEPGRVIVGNTGVLLTRVLYRKKQDSKRFLVVDAGMNDMIRPALYNSHHEIKPVKQTRAGKQKVDVVGPICESSDFLARDRELPNVPQGALLAVFSAGAYGFSMASNYNSRPRPAEVMVKGKRTYLVREREEYDDLISGEIIPRGLG